MNDKQIEILGINYKIKEVEQVDITNHLVYGEINYDNQIIKLNKNLGEDRKRETLWHEIVHGIGEHLKLSELENNEHLVQCLGNSIYQVLKNNNITSF